jgi:hypothetical protein
MTEYEPNFFVASDDKYDRLKKKQRGAGICKNEPLGAGALAISILNEFLSQEQKDVLILNENKAQILPGKLQEKVIIVTLKEETLILKTNSSVWRAEIMAMKAGIASACNKILGKAAVKSVRFC